MMNRPSFFTIIFLSMPLNLTATPNWNCEKNTQGEWTCLTQSPPLSTPQQIITSPAATSDIVQPPLKISPTSAVKKKQLKTPDEIKVKLAIDPAPLARPKLFNESQLVVSPPPHETNNPDGWNCSPNKADEQWDCQLVGVDPKGEVQTIKEIDDHYFSFLPAAFSRQQERAFKNLLEEFPYDPWGQCDRRKSSPPRTFVSKKDLRNDAALDIWSDYSELIEGEITQFIGHVEMNRADQHLRANMANYDSVSGMMNTQGQVYYSEEGLALFGHSAALQLAHDQSIIRDALFISLDGAMRGRAKVAYRDSSTLSHYKDAAYTSCRPGNQDWVLHANRLKMNKESGLGSATHAWLEFKGIPLLYTPYINFPIDDRRTTGFLFPSWGSNEENGFDLEIPFYWNIAPNFDAVLRPRYLSKRGVLLGGEFRYLTALTSGSVAAEYMPRDTLRKQGRFHGKIIHSTHFAPGLVADLDLSYVSDDDYFDELGNTLSITDRRHIRSRADLRYQREGLSFLARGEYYQTIDKTITKALRPYLKLPHLSLNLGRSFDALVPLDVGMNNEYINFYRANSVTGHRFNTQPFISLPLIQSGFYITPKLSYQFTQYALQHQLPSHPSHISRGLPIASVDTGLFFEKAFKFSDDELLHTLEPRLFYLYIPENNQEDIPIFDTALNDFTYNSLFREYSYSGFDRIQNANQLSVGLTSRLINSNTGMEYLRFGLGETFYFADRTARLPGQSIETNALSRVIAELGGRFNEHFSFTSSLQWDPYANDFTRGHIGFQFINRPDQIVNLGYHYRQNELIQSDISFRWPIYDNWYAVGRWQYSLKFNVTKESFIGLEKESCCWRFRVVGRKYINAISDSEEADIQTGIFVQLELKGLSSFGDKVEEFLEENISGYDKP